jgi:hypothetical protein
VVLNERNVESGEGQVVIHVTKERRHRQVRSNKHISASGIEDRDIQRDLLGVAFCEISGGGDGVHAGQWVNDLGTETLCRLSIAEGPSHLGGLKGPEELRFEHELRAGTAV